MITLNLFKVALVLWLQHLGIYLGNYLLAPSYHVAQGRPKIARIKSPVVQRANGTFCLTFYYFMAVGALEFVGNLKCFVQNPFDTLSKREICSFLANEDGQWTYTECQGNATSPFQVSDIEIIYWLTK